MFHGHFWNYFSQNIKSSYPGSWSFMANSSIQRKYVILRMASRVSGSHICFALKLVKILRISRSSWCSDFSLLHSIMSRSMNTIMHYSGVLFGSFLWLFAYLDGPYNRCITTYNDNNLLMCVFFTYSESITKTRFFGICYRMICIQNSMWLVFIRCSIAHLTIQ